MRAQLEQSVNKALVLDLGALCLGERDHYHQTEVQQCIRDKPELADKAEALRQGAQAQLTKLVLSGSKKLIRETMDATLCAELGSRVD